MMAAWIDVPGIQALGAGRGFRTAGFHDEDVDALGCQGSRQGDPGRSGADDADIGSQARAGG